MKSFTLEAEGIYIEGIMAYTYTYAKGIIVYMLELGDTVLWCYLF